MHRINVVAVAALLSLGLFVGFAIPVSAQSVTAFEVARLIVGDGRVIENATLVVDGDRTRRLAGLLTYACLKAQDAWILPARP